MNPPRLLSLPLLLLLSCAVSVLASKYQKITVNSPRSLVDALPTGIDFRPALFAAPGFITMTGEVYSAALVQNNDGCAEFDPARVTWPVGLNKRFMLIDRGGGCTFVTKVRNAQKVGADAVVVVDDREEAFLPPMADDGTAQTGEPRVKIPSVLIRKADGEKIKQGFIGGAVVLTITWGMPAPDDTVEWTLWTSSNDPPSRPFKKAFGIAHRALATRATFTPRYYVINGTQYGCDSAGLRCAKQCVNNGRYCAADPEGDLSRGLDGEDVVIENLRQMCLWQSVSSAGKSELWWDYVNCFDDKCAPNDATWNEDCAKTCTSAVGIDYAPIAACMTSSGGAGATVENANTLLDQTLQARIDDGIYTLPSIIINDVIFHGDFACSKADKKETCRVLAAICTGYQAGTEPTVCTYGVCDPAVEYPCGVCGRDCSTSHGMSAGSVIGIVVAIIVVVSIGVFAFTKWQQARMRREMDAVLQSYMPLDEANRITSKGRQEAGDMPLSQA